MPDIFVPADTSQDIQSLIKVRGFIPEFVYDYMAVNSEKFNQFKNMNDFARIYSVSDELYHNFISSAKEKKMDVSDTTLTKLEPDVKVLFKAYIARQLWKNDGFYSVVNSIDKTFLRTLEILKNPESLAETKN